MLQLVIGIAACAAAIVIVFVGLLARPRTAAPTSSR